MNLFELQERLKDFSQDQLVREMQAPSGTAPQYLVLSELQRRQRMMAEEQASMQTPQTTVAQDAIAAAGVPQGGLADMAQAMAPQTDMDMNTAVQPVERMADGGVVRMQPGGLAGISRDVRDFAPRMPAEIMGVRREDFSLLSPEEQLAILEFEDPTIPMRERAAEEFPAYDPARTGQGFLIETLAPRRAAETRASVAAARDAEEAPDADEGFDLPELVIDSESEAADAGLSFGDQFGEFDPNLAPRAGDDDLAFGDIEPTGAPISLPLPRATEQAQPPRQGGTGGAGGVAAPAVDDAFDQDKWLALAQFGLNLMSSQQPTIGGAIGEAGLAGITALRQARDERDERLSAQQARSDRLAASASRGEREEAYPYRQVDDIISMADSYASAASAIVEDNFGTPPVEGDSNYEQYINSLAMANVLRRRALALTGLE